MNSLIKKIKEKFWLWRPVGLFAIIGIIIFTSVSNEIHSTDVINTLRRNKPISKIEMNIVSDAGVNNIILTNRTLLDSINNAFKVAREKKIQLAKVFDTEANINVYKENRIINLSIQHSVYSGWTIIAGDKILISDYLSNVVKRYAK